MRKPETTSMQRKKKKTQNTPTQNTQTNQEKKTLLTFLKYQFLYVKKILINLTKCLNNLMKKF